MQILGSVHFEKILPDNFNAISATTSRMALRDALINNREPSKYCKIYMKELNNIIQKLEQCSNLHLKDQPIFEWFVCEEPHFSPCWRFEQLMVMRCLSLHLMAEGKALMVESDFKGAKKLFEEASAVCTDAILPAKQWSFRDIPTLACTYAEFWPKEVARCDAYSKLCSFQFAISSGHAESQKSASLLNVVCRKMLKSCEQSLFQGPEVGLIYDLGVLCKAYIYAQQKWDEGNYPDALALFDYETVPKPDLPVAHVLLKWMKDREVMFETWRHECNNVHFVTKSRELPEVPLE